MVNISRQNNKYGWYGFTLSIASAFFYPFLILQVLALGFSYLGFKDAQKNPILSKWQSVVGLVIGSIYLFMFFISLIKFPIV